MTPFLFGSRPRNSIRALDSVDLTPRVRLSRPARPVMTGMDHYGRTVPSVKGVRCSCTAPGHRTARRRTCSAYPAPVGRYSCGEPPVLLRGFCRRRAAARTSPKAGRPPSVQRYGRDKVSMRARCVLIAAKANMNRALRCLVGIGGPHRLS